MEIEISTSDQFCATSDTKSSEKSASDNSVSSKECVWITEGSAKLVFTDPCNAFYNPVQEFNRDLTVTVLRQFVEDRRAKSNVCANKSEYCVDLPKRKKSCQSSKLMDGMSEDDPIRILDALSASGLRALRFAKEVPHVSKIVANDFSSQAVETIKRNIVNNGLESVVEANFGDAVQTMMEHRFLDKRFHAVDLDPYGSVSSFLDAAVQAVADKGILMITCTDMAVLCGNTPESCYNKYGSLSLRHKSCHEFALRILLKTVDSHANRYSRYIEPLLSVSIDFYVRVFLRMHTSAHLAKDSVLKVSYVMACTGCHTIKLQPLARKTISGGSIKYSIARAEFGLLSGESKCVHCNQVVNMAGPIYSAPIHDIAFVNRILERLRNTPTNERLGTHERLIGVLSVISEELLDAPLYCEIDDFMHVVKAPVPRASIMHSAILNAGYRCSISHCNPKALKTDAPAYFLWDIARTIAKNKDIPLSRHKENSAGYYIMKKEIRNTIDFRIHGSVKIKNRLECGVRFQDNKGKNWGPKSKAKGSIHSVNAGFQFSN